jgi:hypothetical protein
MKSNARARKLALKKETLRNLQNIDLKQVVGGQQTLSTAFAIPTSNKKTATCPTIDG